MAMSRPWKRAVGWAAVAALGAGLVSSVVSAQLPRATVTAYGFELSCDESVSEGSTLVCTLSNTSDEAADWPTVGIVHLSSDDDRALVVGSPVDVAFGALEGGPETEDDVWWIGDVLVGYSRFDWDGQATASSGSETTDSRTVNIVVADDTAWEEAESFYVALAPSGARGVGFLYDHRQKVTIGRSDSKSGDATLASLVISAGGTTTDLTPPPISHRLMAEYTTTELTVAPTATYKPSGISVAVDSGAAYSFAAQSGDETRAIPLAVGSNTISVTVTAEDGASSQTYKVVVDRASLVDGATVTASSDEFSLTCPGTVAEGSTMECTLTSLSTSPANWPVVAFLHSSADVSRALIAEDPIIPESSLLYSQDIRLKDPQVPAVDNYNYGYGELFSGGSRSVYATYGYEKFDWFGTAEASTSRNVSVEVLADGLDEGNEIFYAAIADSAYTGLSDLVDNKVPIVVRGTPSAVPVEAIGKNEAADVFWTGLDAVDGESVTSYDLRYIRSDATDRSDGNWEVRTPIWTPGGGVLAFELTDLVNDVSYDIQLRAVAGTTTGPWSTTQTVTPRPNEPPAFPDTETGQRSVVEGAIAGRSVGAPISATDPEGDTLLYSLQSGGDVFDIRAATGQLSTKAELDYETAATHSVVIAVSDGKDLDHESDPAVDATVEVTVSVIDVNEPPAFPDTETGQRSVVEGAIAGRSVGAPISATDPEGDTLLYSLQSGGDVFDIRAATGQLSTKAELDYETAATHSVVIAVSDGKDLDHESDPAVDATVEVTVSVIDVNEPPAFPDTETGQRSVVEGAIAGRSVGAPISATDPEGDTLLYSLQSGGDVFDIRAATGQLSTKAELDYETAATHSVVIAVSDGKDLDGESDPAVDATVEVTVSVIDVNEPPAFPDSETGQRSVVEGAIAGRSVGAPISATDPEGDTLLYSLQSGGDVFDIRAATGQLSTKAELDYETAATHSVVIAVSDGKDLDGESDPAVDATVEVTVSVIDVNEPPAFPDSETGQRSVVEGAIAGRSVGAPISATDPEGDTLLYSLQSGGDVFDIRAATGQLSTKAELDYETAATHSVVIAVSDGKDLDGESDPAVDATVEVTVSVIDVNEPPAFPDSETGQRSVVEGAIAGRSVGAPISATDREGDTLLYSLQSGGDVFDIRAATGQLSTKAELDYETAATHSVVIAVSDGKDLDHESDPAVDATVEVTVSVIDVNEPPAFPDTETGQRSVVEGAIAGRSVGAPISATDPEGDTLLYSLQSGGDVFDIRAATGQLSTKAELDYETAATHSVVIAVSDGKDLDGESDPAVDATVEVTVSVIDVNEPPAFPDTETGQHSVVEGAIAGRSVGAPISATDPEGDTLVYSLQSGGDVFDIRAATGQLLTKAELDYETAATHSVVVAVSDGKDLDGEPDPAVDATVDVTVSVTDVNEPPALSGPSAVEFVEGGDDSVGAYAAVDPDGDEVSWSVGGADAASFEISAEGVLRFLSPPDFEAPGDADGDNAYQVQVRVTDGKDTAGEPDAAVDATVEVTVSVTDVNEPPALSGPSAVEFVEGGDDSVGAYAAVDPDGDEVSWSVGGADAASFEISAEGVLRFLSPPDFEAPGDADGDNAYQVQVRVTDGKDTAGEPDAAVDATVEVTVSVTDVAEWSVVAVPARVAEGAVSTVTVSVDKAFEADQTITLAATGGTAASGDYSLSPLSLTLVAGDMSVTASVTAVDDSVIDGGDETVVVTASHGGGAVGSATVTIEDNDTAVWSVVAVPGRVAEGAVSTVTVSVDKAFEVDQTITLAATGGTAASGDYSLSSLSLTLGAGDMSVTASVTAVDDSVIDGGDETVVVTASHGDETVGSATVTIEDNDTAVWSVVAVPARVVEGAASTVTVSVDKAFEVDQTITLAVGGTAASGDYSLSPLSLTLVAGDMSVTASVTAVDDSVIDGGDETVVVTASHGGGAVGSATVTIEDNDTPTWSVVAVPARVVEGAASTVTVSVDKEFEVDQTITLAATGGTAASADYSLSSLSLTLDAGDMSVTASVTAVDDSDEESDETVVVTASPTATTRSVRRRSPSKPTTRRCRLMQRCRRWCCRVSASAILMLTPPLMPPVWATACRRPRSPRLPATTGPAS